MVNNKISHGILALLCFMGFIFEWVLLSVETEMYNSNDIAVWGLEKTLLHWCIVYIVWGMVALFTIACSKKQYGEKFTNMSEKQNKKSIFIVGLLILIIAIVMFLLWGNNPKPVMEYKVMNKYFGKSGWLAFLFQYIYYAFETLLMVLSIHYAQKFGEYIFKKNNVIWGGLFLGLSWGIFHILTKNIETGIYGLCVSFIYGWVYLLLKRDIRYVFPAIYLMFVL